MKKKLQLHLGGRGAFYDKYKHLTIFPRGFFEKGENKNWMWTEGHWEHFILYKLPAK
jgi:hypothetical protein